MRPAESYSDGFRFEKGESAEGLFYDSGKSDKTAFIDEFVTLEGAFHALGTYAFLAGTIGATIISSLF